MYLNYLFFDTVHQRLIAGNPSLPVLSWDKTGWHHLIKTTILVEGKLSKSGFNRQILLSRNGQYYYGLPNGGFDIAEAATGKSLLNGASVADRRRPACIAETPNGQILAALPEGLHYFRDSTYSPAPALPAPLTRRIRTMEWLPDSTLVAGANAGGVCFWKGAFFRQITAADGLTSDRVLQLAVQGDSIVWAGGNLGLNKITGWLPGHTLRVEQITVAHGLPSNEINDLCVAGGYLWAATAGGLVRLKTVPPETAAPMPLLAGIFVNGKKYPEVLLRDSAKRNFAVQPVIAFSASENNLEFRFFALNYRQNGRILYRFRINPEAPWQTGQAISAVFSSLSPGNYRFEVQAENESGHWSEPLFFAFKIRPPWWADWPFRTALAVLLGGAVFAFFKWRTGQLKAKFALQNQLAELEQTALRAQMNPHFIFNCLNSVQRCIAEGQTDDALRYLARFAKLVRQVLSLSGQPSISLLAEIEYLETYLSLEKIRFKERFNFLIETGATMEPAEIRLPPCSSNLWSRTPCCMGFRAKNRAA